MNTNQKLLLISKIKPTTNNKIIKTYNNIMHAGGKIDGIGYTNSLEGILYNIENNNSNIFEIDVIKIKNNYVIAHDGKEKMYGYEGSFKDIDIETFNNLKICDKYTPMDFFKLKELMTNNPNLKFILDIKESKANYNNCLKYVNNILGDLIINIIPQVYNIDDLRCCINNNFKICLVALWKYHSYIHSENTLNFINELIKFKIKIFGISIFFKNYNTSNFRKNYSNTRYKIYFHGQNLTSTEIESYNNIGIHFFA